MGKLVSEALKFLPNSPTKCAEKIINAYGGMNSFNDTGIGYYDKNNTPEELRFNELHDEIFQISKTFSNHTTIK